MIQQQTVLNVSDNSGAKTVRCIKVLGGFKRKVANIGDSIIVVVSQLRNKSRNKSKVKKGEIFKALVIKTKYNHLKPDGSTFKFDNNSVVLLTKQEKHKHVVCNVFPHICKSELFDDYSNKTID